MDRWAALKALADTAADAVSRIISSEPRPCAFPNPKAQAFAIATCRNAAHNILALCDELSSEAENQAPSEAQPRTPAPPPPVARDR